MLSGNYRVVWLLGYWVYASWALLINGSMLFGRPPSICLYSITRILLSNSRFISRVAISSFSFSAINHYNNVNRGEERGVR